MAWVALLLSVPTTVTDTKKKIFGVEMDEDKSLKTDFNRV
jgi:hypothetical protein